MDDADWSTQRVVDQRGEYSENEEPTDSDIIELSSDDDVEANARSVTTSKQLPDPNNNNNNDEDDAIVILDDAEELPAAAKSPAHTHKSVISSPALQPRITTHFPRNAMALLMAVSRKNAAAERAQSSYRVSAPASTAATSSASHGAVASSSGKGGPARSNGSSENWRSGTDGRTQIKGRGGSYKPSTPCPFYKRVPGTPFVVDGFQWASSALSSHYILSHFHADHYMGLSKSFDAGTIYCTSVTAALLRAKMKIPLSRLRCLPLDTPTVVAGVTLTLIDANHCPGAAMFLFQLPSGSAYLHVGDFRWTPSMLQHPALAPYAAGLHSGTAPAVGRGVGAPAPAIGSGLGLGLAPHAAGLHRVESGSAAAAASTDAAAAQRQHQPPPFPPRRRLARLYLDTTFASREYDFPSQASVIEAAVSMVKRYAADPGVLFVFGAYTIGKEKLYLRVAKELRERVYVDATRYATMQCLGLSLDEMSMLTTDPRAARIHVKGLWGLSLSKLSELQRELRNAYAGALSFTTAPSSSSKTTTTTAGSFTAEPSSSSSSKASKPGTVAQQQRVGKQRRLESRLNGGDSYLAELMMMGAQHSSSSTSQAASSRATGSAVRGGALECSRAPTIDVIELDREDEDDDIVILDADDELAGGNTAASAAADDDTGGGFETGFGSSTSCGIAALTNSSSSNVNRALISMANVTSAAAAAASYKRYGPFHSVVAFRPTGWAHSARGTPGASTRTPAATSNSASTRAPSAALQSHVTSASSSSFGSTSSSSSTRSVSVLSISGTGTRAVINGGGGGGRSELPDADSLPGDTFDVYQVDVSGAIGESSWARSTSDAYACGSDEGHSSSGAPRNDPIPRAVEDTARESRTAATVEARVLLDEPRILLNRCGSGEDSGSPGVSCVDGDDVLEYESGQRLPSSFSSSSSSGTSTASRLNMQSSSSAPASRDFFTVASQHHIVTVRMSCQTRSGGARVRGAAELQLAAAPVTAAPALSISTSSNSGATAAAAAAGSAGGGKKRRKSTPAATSTTSSRAAGAGGVTLFSVPYSEHSSFPELRECVAALNPVEIVPTVNCRDKRAADALVSLLRGRD